MWSLNFWPCPSWFWSSVRRIFPNQAGKGNWWLTTVTRIILSSLNSVQFSRSVMSNSLGPLECSMSGFPVLYHLPELVQARVHWVGDAIQTSHPLLSPSPPALNLSQHQGLFQWVGSSHQVAKVSELQLQHQSFQWMCRVDFLLGWLVWSPCCPRDFQESSPILKPFTSDWDLKPCSGTQTQPKPTVLGFRT